MLSETREVKVRTSRNPHHVGETLEVTITVQVPASVQEADDFPYIGKTGLEIVQDYYATQQANAARQMVLAVSSKPTVEGCQKAADDVLTEGRRKKAAPEVSSKRLVEVSGDPEKLAEYLAALGIKVN